MRKIVQSVIRHSGFGIRAGGLGCAVSVCLASARADVDPLTGLDFATVGAVGNAPWQRVNGDPDDQAHGRGRVDYEYRIAKTEVTGGVYNEFLFAAFNRPQSEWIPFLGSSPTVNGSGDHMVGGISWRQGAILCNWLHNGKATNREAFLTGAYDVSTFGNATPFGFTDQRERSPGARYFLPTWDEWLKAAHFDPSKQNPDGTTGGWWRYANMRDEPMIYGAPISFGDDGTGMANAGFNLPGFGERNIPANSYPTQLSPWGLLDTAGGMTEWLESAQVSSGSILFGRFAEGSAWGSSLGAAAGTDYAGYLNSEQPNIGWSDFGIRIGMSVPAPGSVALGVGTFYFMARRRRNGGLYVESITHWSRRSRWHGNHRAGSVVCWRHQRAD